MEGIQFSEKQYLGLNKMSFLEEFHFQSFVLLPIIGVKITINQESCFSF